MPSRFIDIMDATHIRMIAASGFLILTFLADAMAQLPSGWEDTGIKGLLIAAVVYLVRELAKQRDTDKAEAAIREDRSARAIDANTATLKELINATNLQTNYYRDVARVLVEKGSGVHLPEKNSQPSNHQPSPGG